MECGWQGLCEQFWICWQAAKCRLRPFGKRYVRRCDKGSFVEAKLRRQGDISLIASKCELFSESGRLMEPKGYGGVIVRGPNSNSTFDSFAKRA